MTLRVFSDRYLAPLVLLPILAAPSMADTVTALLRGSYVESVTAGGVTVPATGLAWGASSGEVIGSGFNNYAITAADGRNLATYFARNGADPEWEVDLTAWRNSNGNAHDFFLFEVGGNDLVTVAPKFANGSYGQDVSIGGWTPTDYSPTTGINHGQQVYGLAFRHTRLLDPNGTPLSGNVLITGLRFRSTNLDAASFLHIKDNPSAGADGDGSHFILGTPRQSSPFEIAFRGPWASETDIAPNPFYDYRLSVIFRGPNGIARVVPGFFDGDGADGDAGLMWKVRFTPPIQGPWTASVDFRTGPDVAIDLDPYAGQTNAPLHGRTFPIQVAPADPNAPGFYKYGQLEYVGGHYPRFKGGPYFLKTGANSPENFLGYRGFDGPGKVENAGIGVLHGYGAHVQDWNPGDPLFTGRAHDVDSRGIIGALNYLSESGVNSIHTMLMNLGGDGDDVYPFLGPTNTVFDKTHYDTSRLRQWNTVLDHAARKGIALHIALAETEVENETWLDGGALGRQRKLFYREVVARFAHLPAIKWTLSEENDYTAGALRNFADYIGAHDSYDHPVTFHNFPNDFAEYYAVLGEERFSATAFQFHPNQIGDQVEDWRQLSTQAGRPWLIHADEHTPWNDGARNSNSNDIRKRILYDVLFSGGHIEWYAGFHDLPLGGDLNMEDFRTRSNVWRDSRFAREFMEENLPFWRMEPADHLLGGESSQWGGGEVFIAEGEVYAIYLGDASPAGTLNLGAATGTFIQRWFNPRTGSFHGAGTLVQAGGLVSLGTPPSTPGQDWIVLLDRGPALEADVAQISVTAGGIQGLTLAPGPTFAGRPYLVLGTMSGSTPGFPVGSIQVPLNFDTYTRFTSLNWNSPDLQNTQGNLDGAGTGFARIRIAPGAWAPMVGETLHHAFVLIDGRNYASNPVSLLLVP
ncbi:MAG: DUF5060 domain-containing protein [bacterium]|nr:DUF5060 domain-containing protein [bacterium]